MVQKNKNGGLTDEEKPIVKALLIQGCRNQDIQHLVNQGRAVTINPGRISEVKKDDSMTPADVSSVDRFLAKQQAYDPVTGLNPYENERLIRAREAMISAVQNFNSPASTFKTQQFSVLANIAWTYMLHEYLERKSVQIVGKGGRSLSLSKMIKRQDMPLSNGMVSNIQAMIKIRNKVEHELFGQADQVFIALFQANCLNFDKILCKWFGQKLSLQNELSLVLWFCKPDFDQVREVAVFDIPETIKTLDKALNENAAKKPDSEYQFKMYVGWDSASKSNAHIRFISPECPEDNQIRNILTKSVIADDQYPYKPGRAAAHIAEKSKRVFTLHNHTQAWRCYKVRPRKNASQPESTNKNYCVYHKAHKDYTYNDAWIEFVVDKISSDSEYETLRNMKL